MKNVIIFLVSIAVFLSIRATSQTVIYQCDFESWTGNYPDGWGGAGTTISPDSVMPYTANPHSGTKACRLENRATYQDTLFSTQTITLIKGHQYKYRCWMKGKGMLRIYFANHYLIGDTVGSTTWIERNYTFIASSNISFAPYIVVYKTNESYDDVQIDDIIFNDYGIYQTFLDTNNISAMVNANGSLFWDLQGNAKFEVPKGSGKTSIFSAGLWLCGLDTIDSLHTATVRYCQGGNDFQIGPIAHDYQSTSYISKYSKLWKINKSDIDYHINHFNAPGYVMPSEIQDWPGNGDVNNGEAAELAPYMDLNGNGIYEPQLGEYPLIRGDQAIYFILNDDTLHTESMGKKFGIEEHVMLYSYNMPSDSALYNNIFLTYRIINRSDTNYHDVYLGSWTDTDIGDGWDDYIGSDSTLNFFYGYNGDEIDGDGNGQTYGAHPPAQGMVILNHPMTGFMYFSNTSGAQGDPSNASEYYHIFHSYWKDGTPLTYGGTGYNSSSILTNFAFSGKPEDSTGWSEVTAHNTPGDRRGVEFTGPFMLPAGGSLCLEIAFPFARDYTGTSVSSVALLRQRVQSIKTFFDAQHFNCLEVQQSISPLNAASNFITVLPNPSEGIFTVHQGNFVIPYSIKVYNALGVCINETTILQNDALINLSQQPSGIYLYIAQDKAGIIQTGKLLIIK